MNTHPLPQKPFEARLEPSTSAQTTIEILAVMPAAEDRTTLDRILTAPDWSVRKAATLTSAVDQISEKHPPLILCNHEVDGASWRDVLDHIRGLAASPLLVVASRMADEHLWAEALNLGAYDVLAIPFEASEVQRTLNLAWQRWQKQHVVRASSMTANG